VEAAQANKRENLDYQIRAQAAQLLEHYQPRRTQQRLERALDPEAADDLAEQYFPPAYCGAVMGRLNSDRELYADWSTMLFRKRVACWSLLGVIAWPVTLLGAVLPRWRAVVPGVSAAGEGDVYRRDGLSLEERTEGLLAGMRARLGGLADKLRVQLVTADALAKQFRTDVFSVVEEHRAAAIEPFVNRRPRIPGRLGRWLLPLLVLLWFPLVQPVLAGVLGGQIDGTGLSSEMVLTLVQAMSAGKVLSGLCVSLLILAALCAAVYSRAVRDTYRALEALRGSAGEIAIGPLRSALVAAITRPIAELDAELDELTETLETFREAGAAAD